LKKSGEKNFARMGKALLKVQINIETCTNFFEESFWAAFFKKPLLFKKQKCPFKTGIFL